MLNPWWKEGKVGNELALPYKRRVFTEVAKLLKLRQIVIISGLRRVGKSTLMYQVISELLSKVKSQNILYFSFDEKVGTILEILEKYSELTQVDWKHEKCFIFLDEIPKLNDWSNKLKIIYDKFPNLKFVISGSSSFQLEKEAEVNLVGRHFTINVKPLSFSEYLELKKSKIELNKIKLWEDELKKEFSNYLLRPFPEIVDFKDAGLIKNYIKDNVVEKILRVDLMQKFKHINEDILEKLVDIVYSSPGLYVNYDELAKNLGISKKTLIQHIFYLEFAYVIRKIKNFRPNLKVSVRKLQRLYPFHWALRFGWNGNIDAETIVASFFDAKYYWRKDLKEVDFLILGNDILPIEVKESQKISRDDLNSLFFFLEKYNLKKGLLAYNGDEGIVNKGNCVIEKVPIWKMFLKKM